MVSQNSWNNIVPNNDVQFQRTGAGVTQVTMSNHTDNTSATSNAKHRSQVGGAAGGDAFVEAAVAATRAWAWGLDNTDSDSLKEVTAAAGSTDPSSGTLLRKMTTAGQQTMPLQPCFHAYLSANVPNATGAAASWILACDTETVDQGSNYDNTTFTFTVPVNGNYLFAANVTFQNITVLMNRFALSLSKTNAPTRSWQTNNINVGAVQNAANAFASSSTWLVPLLAGDTIQFAASIQDGAGNTATAVGISGTTEFTTVQGYLVC